MKYGGVRIVSYRIVYFPSLTSNDRRVFQRHWTRGKKNENHKVGKTFYDSISFVLLDEYLDVYYLIPYSRASSFMNSLK